MILMHSLFNICAGTDIDIFLRKVSKRALRRRLEKAGTSFMRLKCKALNTRAKALLSQNHLVEEVADFLGYSDERSFRRAFLRWNNITPAKFNTKPDR